MLKSVAAVISGFLAITALSLAADALVMIVAPWWFTGEGGTKHLLPLAFALVYSCCFFVAGGYLTALIAGRAEKSHALVLAALLFAMSVAATIQMFETAPLWWHSVMLIQIVPAVLLGGLRRAAGKRKFYPRTTYSLN